MACVSSNKQLNEEFFNQMGKLNSFFFKENLVISSFA